MNTVHLCLVEILCDHLCDQRFQDRQETLQRSTLLRVAGLMSEPLLSILPASLCLVPEAQAHTDVMYILHIYISALPSNCWHATVESHAQYAWLGRLTPQRVAMAGQHTCL